MRATPRAWSFLPVAAGILSGVLVPASKSALVAQGFSVAVGESLGGCTRQGAGEGARELAYGGSKEAGAVVGRITAGSDSFEDAEDIFALLESTGVEESYRCTVHDVPCSLTARLSPETGEVEWEQQDEAEVLRRTIQMSQMVSMMHDSDRNAVYNSAIFKIIDHFKKTVGRPPVVLDVGAGTGLLSCMAARSGASSVVGCEMFDAMAAIASQVAAFDETISIVPAKSLDLVLDDSADVLVSELLDSSLLGESVVFSHSDAITRLIRPDDGILPPLSERVIPHSAEVYATLVESLELRNMQSVSSFNFGGSGTPFRSEFASQCRGGRSVVPCHWREIKSRGERGRELSEATGILAFEFFHVLDDECEEEKAPKSKSTDITVSESGTVHGVISWWKLHLLSPVIDPERTCTYSTAPGDQQWQDHWVQVAHLLPTPIDAIKGDVIRVTARHDNLRIWLECEVLIPSNQSPVAKRVRMTEPSSDNSSEAEQCLCGWHLLDSPFRLCALNDLPRRNLWETAVKNVIDRLVACEHDRRQRGEKCVILDLSDESILALTAALRLKDLRTRHKHLKVVSKERKLLSLLHFSQLTDTNDCGEFLTLWDGDGSLADFVQSCEDEDENDGDGEGEGESKDRKVRVASVICECFNFQMQARPTWGAVSFLYQCRNLQREFDLSETLFVPRAAKVMLIAFELIDLFISHGEAGVVSGFDHSPLDLQIQGWEQHWFPYKLADYRKIALTEPTCIAVLNYATCDAQTKTTQMIVSTKGRCDCVAVYVDYALGFDLPDVDVREASWYKHNLRFFSNRRQVDLGEVLEVKVEFDIGDSDFKIDVTLEQP